MVIRKKVFIHPATPRIRFQIENNDTIHHHRQPQQPGGVEEKNTQCLQEIRNFLCSIHTDVREHSVYALCCTNWRFSAYLSLLESTIHFCLFRHTGNIVVFFIGYMEETKTHLYSLLCFYRLPCVGQYYLFKILSYLFLA